ncbi:MAG: hypothetical protein WKF40_03420 [Thermoleophilaceae bacterium]
MAAERSLDQALGARCPEPDAHVEDRGMDVTVDREKQAPLLKALLDDEDFRARASELVMGSIYEGLRDGPN